MKSEPGAWGYIWTTLSLGDINTEHGSPCWMLDARLTTLLFEKITVAKSNEVEIGRPISQKWINLPESSEGGI
jgi:hypothetical protein